MFDMVSGIFCFVTATVSFLYGTRICWVCGKKCNFQATPTEKRLMLKASLPGGFAVYCFGFFIVFATIQDGPLTIIVMSLTSALLLSHFVVSMAMPLLKRPPSFNNTGPFSGKGARNQEALTMHPESRAGSANPLCSRH